jgi:hypothetical protein
MAGMALGGGEGAAGGGVGDAESGERETTKGGATAAGPRAGKKRRSG